MSSITALKDKLTTPTLHFVLLSVATGGVYPLLWLWKHQETIMQETGRAFSSSLLVLWTAICFGLAAFLRPYAMPRVDEMNYIHTPVVMIALTFILTIACCVLYIVWAFKARSALQHYALTQFHFELKMNLFYTFLFNVYYINYCINALPDSLVKHQLLRGQTQSTTQTELAQAAPTDQQPPSAAE
ncbi:DUF4234 domain-containing protein [Salmonella enterica]|nr:DUF4234 domain-containing protein [Salmonella enterica]EGO6394571.1 DUF4234 domain-containing protein [Salmonella enterica]